MSIENRVDLTNCDREPIHIPGSIQPHGCLLACDMSAGIIHRHSANLGEMLGVEINPNGKRLEEIVGADATHTIRNALARFNEPEHAALVFSVALSSGRIVDVAAHTHNSNVILEFEPASTSDSQPLEKARAMIARISSLKSVERLIQSTSRIVQALLGYDRVMVYQFAQDGAGKVVSETKRGDLESFLGQYFPASDIPQQARALYLRNTIRVISDANFNPVPVTPALNASGEALDLSFSHLRSVSPVHCEYLRNMGVGASMSISIIVDGALWGLIACHHYSPRILTMSERVAAEMFGEFFSLHLSALRQKQKLEAATRARQALDKFLRTAARAEDIELVLRSNLTDFADLITCNGIGIWMGGKWTGSGDTPPENLIEPLTRLVQAMGEGRIWATDKLSALLPQAATCSASTAGVLAVPLSQRPRDYLFFFRKELVQTLEWAGNPEKSYETGPLGDRLTPRRSFDIWKEEVRKQSAPWTEEEQEIAEAARSALVEIVLHHSELLADERAKAAVRQKMLNEELNHRVKNILAVIKSLVMRTGPEGGDIETYAESLRGRIQALAHAHDQVVRSDGGGALEDLIASELTPYRDGGSKVSLSGPPVWLDARAFSVLALTLHELATNAAKYGALSRAGGSLAVRWSLGDTGVCELFWQESGGPVVKPPAQRGFGTTLIDRSVPFDLGGESDIKYPPSGVEAKFRLPARHVSAGQPSEKSAAPSSRSAASDLPAADLSQIKVLLLEDQMLIAMDLEQILADHGVVDIVTVVSSAEALTLLQEFSPDIAILDINLGDGTSAPVAEELAGRNIPFLFATGYGDNSMLPPQFASHPMINKPYNARPIIEQILLLLDGKLPR